MSKLIGRTWEDETPEVLDGKINRLQNDIKDIEQDKHSYFIANDGETFEKPIFSSDGKFSFSTVKYKNKIYSLTCGDSMKFDRCVAWCDVHEGKDLYESMKKKYRKEE